MRQAERLDSQGITMELLKPIETVSIATQESWVLEFSLHASAMCIPQMVTKLTTSSRSLYLLPHRG